MGKKDSVSKLSASSRYRSERLPEVLYEYRFNKLFDRYKAILKKQKRLRKNPFEGSDDMDAVDWAKFVFGFVLVPLRILFLFVVFLISSLVQVAIVSGQDTSKPLPDYVMRMQQMVSYVSSNVACFVLGFIIDVKGEPVPIEECKVQVFGPHSSWLDAIIMSYANDGYPLSAVGKAELASNPLSKRVTKATQNIMVDRANRENKDAAKEAIIERATSPEWKRRVVLFPEGTTHNRTSLIQFKGGAFNPGVPIQPVVIRWDEEIAWASGSASRMWLALRALAEPYHVCQVEFLPVYHPNDEEKENPIFFANNVREVMAKALDVGTTEFGFPDRALAKYVAKRDMLPSKVLNFPFAEVVEEIRGRAVDMRKFESDIKGQLLADVKLLLKFFVEFCDKAESKLSEENFEQLMGKKFEERLKIEGKGLNWSSFPISEDNDISFKKFAIGVLRVKYD
uniref:Phospholipid/glycerol acyltransferase domain-containing protein n=1 Tax=Aplanochytrium stocchinoi TaxID=215587 RepID=A0A7S3LRV8_9STRA|mmetsp:Transcript_17513/g.22309  ORF Transcript_17513/g.22309 Transcript_17513/m.22309 type:complete len:452 (-) Transcript_17513:279-1634(-)|eukprot:CAMPEP_0204862056 /NCGR_PEP_ID=MMETSP1348-20121228/2161_1 /ASSEMBLY_ACC=CAM_ASM_000700 /TAXON_ID=215587 /ORGANISM="Aplanochytrium stocchinoi, Strain GSBS06" /LENGTH=451 /DNA_ID=CAMNT_0052011799 /DNA_START=161 /DNA_END=1516 /DNA_ORIENTATION=+